MSEQGMPRSKKSSVARDFAGLPMKEIIGAPLKAAADANGLLARSQTQFILDTCFQKTDRDEHIEPIMVSFSVSRSIVGSSGELEPGPSLKMSIPLLSLLPMNSLAVKSLKVEFDMEIQSSNYSATANNPDPDGSEDATKTNDTFQHTEFYGGVSPSSKNSENTKTSYHVELEAGTLPLPTGLTSMIEIFSKTIAPLPKEK